MGLFFLDVLFALVLEQTEVLVHFLKCVVLAIEGMDHMVLVSIDLIVHIYSFLDELNELLHLLPEQLIYIVREISPKLCDPFLTWAFFTVPSAFRTVVQGNPS